MQQKRPPKQTKLNHFFSILGPGVITGAADDDPSGIATPSQRRQLAISHS